MYSAGVGLQLVRARSALAGVCRAWRGQLARAACAPARGAPSPVRTVSAASQTSRPLRPGPSLPAATAPAPDPPARATPSVSATSAPVHPAQCPKPAAAPCRLPVRLCLDLKQPVMLSIHSGVAPGSACISGVITCGGGSECQNGVCTCPPGTVHEGQWVCRLTKEADLARSQVHSA